MVANPYLERFKDVTQNEHRDLRLYVTRFCEVGDAVGEIPLPVLRERVAELLSFLNDHLIPHAQAENQVIYPLLVNMLGTLEGTSEMLRDHVEIGRFAHELAELEPRLSGTRLRSADAKALRRVLYGLSALLRLHLGQEDAYLGLLRAQLAPETAQSVVEALEAATRKAQERIAIANPE